MNSRLGLWLDVIIVCTLWHARGSGKDFIKSSNLASLEEGAGGGYTTRRSNVIFRVVQILIYDSSTHVYDLLLVNSVSF